jgi:hypothetical protein
MSTDLFTQLGITKEQAAQLLREAEYDKTFQIKNELYVDLSMIQDYKLGMLLSLYTEPDEYKYIYSRISIYNNRFDNLCTKYFPDLGISEEELMKYVVDPEYTADLIKTSPMTLGFYALRDKFKEIVDHNTLIDEKTITYTVVVNIHPLTLNPKIMDEVSVRRIKKFIKDRIKYIHAFSEVLIVDYPIQDMTFGMFKRMNLFMVEDLSGLLNTKLKQDWMLLKGKKESDFLICPRRYEGPIDIAQADKDQIETMFTRGNATMNLVCRFTYCDPMILLEENIPKNDISTEDAMAKT